MAEKEDNSTIQPQKKVKVIKPTAKQRKLARLTLDNFGVKSQGLTTKELLLRSGYSVQSAEGQNVVLRGAGYLQALRELGLTQELVVSRLVEDIEAKPQRRAFELSIAAKILGLERRIDDQGGTNTLIQKAIIIVQQPPAD